MISVPNTLPAIFADSEVPAGPITDEAAEALAALLWAVAEEELLNEQAERQSQGGPERGRNP